MTDKNLFPYDLDRKLRPETWQRGIWDSEPNSLTYLDQDGFNLRCAIVRTQSGALCGYVKLPVGFKDFNEESFSVHGGITYNEDGWVGFDCAHSQDFIPGRPFSSGLSSYKTIAFVKSELESLCHQIRLQTNQAEEYTPTVTDLGI